MWLVDYRSELDFVHMKRPSQIGFESKYVHTQHSTNSTPVLDFIGESSFMQWKKNTEMKSYDIRLFCHSKMSVGKTSQACFLNFIRNNSD